MSDVDQINALSQVIRRVDGNHTMGAGALAEAILDRRTEWDTPRIIRTVEELEAEDRMTVLMNADEGHPLTLVWHWFDSEGNPWLDSKDDLPAVVVATGEQVRAARKALEEA